MTHLVCTPALLYDTVDMARRTSAYPLEEINDYLRLHPEREEAVRHTLSHFDLRRFASRVNATTLLMAGADGSALDAAALAPLIQAMPGEVEVHKAEHSGYKDGRFSEEWLSRRFGMAEASLPAHWRG